MLASAVVVVALAAATADKGPCDFEVRCPGVFVLAARSPSNACAEDDMTVRWTAPSGASNALDVPAAWYVPTPLATNVPTTCVDDAGRAAPVWMRGGHALVLLRYNGRPGYDRVRAVLLEPVKGVVVDQLDLGDVMRATLGVLQGKGDVLRVRLVKGFIKEMNCDCDAAFEEGWLELRVVKGRLTRRWE